MPRATPRGESIPSFWKSTEEVVDLVEWLLEPRGQRAVGVVYHPEYEWYGNYVPTVLPRRYDAMVHVDESRALVPLRVPVREKVEAPETFPTRV